MRLGFLTQNDTVKVGTDGRPFIETTSGEFQYLETAAPSSAVHGNAGFEDETAGIPDVWDFFWVVGSPVVASEATVVYSGTRSLKVTLPAGGTVQQIVLSDIFDVAGGDRIDFSVFAKATVGSPKIAMGLITRNGGTPAFFDIPDSIYNESSKAGVSASWSMYQRQAIAAGGTTKARIYYLITPTASEACTVYLDLTASSVTAADVSDSGEIALPFSSVSWANGGSGWDNCTYRRHGDDLILEGLAGRLTTASGANAVIGTVPVGFRPTAIRYIGGEYLPASGAPVPTQVYINSSGQIISTISIPAGAFVPIEARVSLL